MTDVGVIGLGQIGLPMAENLMKAGFAVVGYRRSRADDFVAAGGIAAKSAREVIDRCEIVLTCLPNEAALDDVVSSRHGLASGDCAGRVVIELSTLDSNAKKVQADAVSSRGGTMLDCSVSGIPKMVRERLGVVYASGEETAYLRTKPFLDAISSKIFYMGAFGNALKVKLCANMLVALNIAATAEALAFGTKLGLEPARLIEALKDGAGASLQFTARASLMSSGEWDVVRGSTATLTKDVHLIEEHARAASCPTPLLENARQLYDAAVAAGLGAKDVASVYALVARAAGIAVPGRNG